jgi:hypothetical protein
MKPKIRTEKYGKYSIPFLLSIAFSLAFSYLSAASGSYQETDEPKDWNFGGDRTSYKPGLDNHVAQHGQNSATIESVAENPSDFCTLMQNIAVKNFSGKRVKMTGFIKAQGTNVKGSMWIRVDDIGNKIFADFDNMMDRPVTGNTDWTKCEIVFDVPEKCLLFFGFIFTGSGKIWVDNVSFEVVGNTIEKTARSLDEPFPDEYLNQLKGYEQDIPEKPPVNLDFEEIAVANH